MEIDDSNVFRCADFRSAIRFAIDLSLKLSKEHRNFRAENASGRSTKAEKSK